jgi:pyruvate dehydrogenase E2 component (dihydrolipoamide acetyltransferase)
MAYYKYVEVGLSRTTQQQWGYPIPQQKSPENSSLKEAAVFEFILPDLGEGIHEAEILKWYVEPGGTIVEDEPLVDLETDKAAVTIPSPKGGTVTSIAGKVGDVINVGNVVAVIDDGTGEAAAKPAEEKAEPAAAEPAPAETTAPPVAAAVTSKGPVPAAPATRRLARELGVEINLVPPTGPAGRVMPEDIRRFAEGGEPTAADLHVEIKAKDVGEDERAIKEFAAHAASTIPLLDLEPLPDFSKWGPVETEQLRSIRRKVARKMVTSMILVPHVAHMDDADVTLLEAFRKREKDRREGTPGGHLTLLSFIVKAVTAGLRAAKSFNASLDPFKEEITYKKYYNIGVAVDSGKGLVVPVIKDTDRKSIIQIAKEIEDLAMRAREGKLEVDELRGGTFTITNVGPLGGTALIPTINYPEVAILGMGKAQQKPVVRDGEIVIRTILPLTLAFDHRIADGADAARFVSEMIRQLADPNLLLLET